ncbi:MAG: choice-of-anchor Q domain-containing protein, partial [Bacteroidota bacterium]
MKKLYPSIVCCCLLVSMISKATIRYVNVNVVGGTGTGLSWANAYSDLQSALYASTSGDQVWVAQGSYLPSIGSNGNPNPTDPRDKTFILTSGVEFYGGFAGSEININQRVQGNITILSGDIGTTGNTTDNCYNVVLSTSNFAATKLDGFTISGGNANGTGFSQGSRDSGGGMFCQSNTTSLVNVIFLNNSAGGSGTSGGGGMANFFGSPSLTNVTFSGNSATGLNGRGGGMLNYNSSPTLTDVSFSANTASKAGGGMSNLTSSPILTDVIFSGNSVTLLSGLGGGMWNGSSSPVLTNVIFSVNSAGDGGGMTNQSNSSPILKNVVFSGNSADASGGMSNSSSSPTLINVTFCQNTVTQTGGGIANNGSTLTIKNCVFWGNIALGGANVSGADIAAVGNPSTITVSYTSLQLANNAANFPPATFPSIGTGNNLFAQNPVFVNAADADGSDNIFMTADDGLELQTSSPCINTGTATGAPLTDITGAARVGNTDMGAYENQGAGGGGCTTFTNHIAYVNGLATGANNGVNWANAFTSLESALDAARNCGVTQIWVAKGTYKPSKDPFDNANPTDPSDKTFYLKDGVAVYGGFAGTETNINQRIAGNVTILSGDIGIAGNVTDNCYHVVLSVSDGNTTLLDGFTITGGNARNGPGGGSITVETKAITRFSGGGMRNESSSPSVTNTIFLINASTTQGGGMFNGGSSSPVLTDLIFSGNSSNGGGGMCNYQSSPTLANIVFAANTSSSGGGVYNAAASPTFTNVTFWANTVASGGFGSGGGMISLASSSPVLKNCIFWGNTEEGSASVTGADIEADAPVTISYTAMQSANTGTNYPTANFPNIGTSSNIFAQNPVFVNTADPDGADNIFMTADDGLALQSASLCINAGTATGAPLTDITGAARVGNTDMGAYEFQGAACITTPGTVTTSATVCSGNNSGTLTLSGQTGTVLRWESSVDNFVTTVTIANTTTTQTYSNLTQTTKYRAVVQNGTCTSANSTAATITVTNGTTPGAVTTDATVCSGNNSGTLTLSGQTGTVLRWESSVDNFVTTVTIANTTTTQTYSNLTQTTKYRAVVQNGTCTSANSTAATITVTNGTTPGAVTTDATVCSGNNSGTLTLSGHTGTILRWESSIDNFVTPVTIANTTTTQTYSNLTQTTKYRAVVQNGTCTSGNSTAATITVTNGTTPGAVTTSATVCSGNNSGTLTLS